MHATLSLTLLPLLAPDVHLTFAPPAGATAEVTLTRHLELSGGELIARLDGQEVPAQFLPELDILLEESIEVVLRDRYVRSEGGRPTELERTFVVVEASRSEETSMVAQGSEQVSESSDRGSSPLEGETVLFHWDDGPGAYEARFARREDGSLELLAGLDPGADLRAWLPEGPVAVGATWTVPADAFEAVWSPGGDLALAYDDAPDLEGPRETRYEGEIELRLEGLSGDDRLATIAVSGEVVGGTVEPTSLDDIPVASGVGVQTTRTVHTLEGELRWSQAAGRLAGLELGAELDVDVSIGTPPGAPQPFESTVLMEGTARYEVVVE